VHNFPADLGVQSRSEDGGRDYVRFGVAFDGGLEDVEIGVSYRITWTTPIDGFIPDMSDSASWRLAYGYGDYPNGLRQECSPLRLTGFPIAPIPDGQVFIYHQADLRCFWHFNFLSFIWR
jgi:hypothetical protein